MLLFFRIVNAIIQHVFPLYLCVCVFCVTAFYFSISDVLVYNLLCLSVFLNVIKTCVT